jgi:hypothetical protein
MNLVLVSFGIIAALSVLAILSIRAYRIKLAAAAVFFIFLNGMFILTFGMGGLRAHAEQVKSEGRSEEFVAGMVERNRFFFTPRLALGISLFGLLCVSIAALRFDRREEDTGQDD